MSGKGNIPGAILGESYHEPDPNKEANLDHGIYLAKVVNNKDQFFTGSIDVEISALHRTTGKKVKSIKKVRFSTPFGGISSIKKIKPEETEKFENTQQSYGMWFSPPDVGSMVLVCFADGNTKHGYVLNHVLPPDFNHMVPSIPFGKSFQGGNFQLPVAEKNKYSEQEGHLNILRPVHHDMAEAITKQGLINDPIRGAGTSGARTYTPSQVTGILTKGPRGTDNTTPIGAGHQFVMDDEPTSSMIRIRSGKGQQILLDDVTGTIYAINKGGKAWVELGQDGNINVFGEGDLNLRTKKSFNLRADYNINIEAGQNIRMKAAGDNTAGEYMGSKLGKLGLPPLGTGGNINFHAAADMGMLAVRNAQLSAIGGDIDINSGNMLKTASGTATSITSATMGVDIKAGAGVIGIAAPSVGITSALTGISGGIINLNTGPAPVLTGLEALKVSAPPLDGNDQEDQPSDQPEYDREGDVVLTSGGKRPGARDKINTIVGTLITAEPYDGHGQFDPTSEDPESMDEDKTADKETLPGQINTGDENPADEVTPEGDKLGNGFKDPASGVVAGASQVADALGNGVDSVGNALGTGIGAITDMIPNMEDISGMISNFLPASMKNLMSMQNMEGMIAAMGIAIPAFRFPTGNALGDKIVGISKEMKELEARLGQFSLNDFDLPIDLDSEAIKEMKGKIAGVVASVNELQSSASQISNGINDLRTHTDLLKGKVGDYRERTDGLTGQPMGSMGITAENFTAVKSKLAEKSIDVTVDGPSLIFADRKTGNKVVDVSNGIGPVGQSLGLLSNLQETKKLMSDLIIVDLSDNQLLALTSFASHIGIQRFANSEVLLELNRSNYAIVPTLMKRWRTGRIGADSEVVVRQDYVQRREYECELFTTPDWCKLTLDEMGMGMDQKNMSFRQLRSLLKSAKEKKYIEMGLKV